jgi:C4-dicarboxylate-binding protein DctP
MTEATTYTNNIAHAENDDALDAMRKAGKTEFHALTADEKAAWKARLLPVHNEVAGRIGKDLIDRIYRATGAA